MPKNVFKYSVKEPYAKLAQAIIEQAEKANDTDFLESEWCEMLEYMCYLDSKKHSKQLNSMSIIRAKRNAGYLSD